MPPSPDLSRPSEARLTPVEIAMVSLVVAICLLPVFLAFNGTAPRAVGTVQESVAR